MSVRPGIRPGGRRSGLRPRSTVWRQLDAAARAAFPTACAAALMILLAAPLGLPAQAQLGGGAALACVFQWSLTRPAWMPPAAVFLLGVLADLLGLAPPGVSVLVLLVAHGLAVGWRRLPAHQDFLLGWLAFAVVAAAATWLEWALCSLLMARPLPADSALLRFALTAGLYPALAALFGRVHRGLADPGAA